ncbi:pentatricopeptide repeat-containing protein At4g21170 [Mercurialis annua]|uniref:pentatricopeptide repeat-containing protein At4g21170 n=1 Tax=Mercurialis annua TaxID=3986 RepID=UPI00215E573F|nr:pentatricopeptide repeat-containing protein At4g21170 [Mercurialis annua]
MLLHRTFSTATSKLNWRNQIKQNQLVSQISSLLLQRKNWIPLVQNLNLSSKLTPLLLLQILHKTQTHPQTSLSFFNWAVTNLKLNPDLKLQCYVINLALGSDLSQPAKTILDSVVQSHPPNIILDSMVQVCRGKTLSFVLEFYALKGLFLEGLEVFKKMRIIGLTPCVHACNKLLDVLLRENEIKLAWCLYSSMIRVGVCLDKVTWSLVASILSKDENFERIVKLLEMGICNSVMYNAVVNCYSKKGEFDAAFHRLNEMESRKIEPGFSTFSSLLDGACRHGNVEMIERVMGVMIERGLLPKNDLFDCDLIVQKLCDLGKTNAAKMFYKRGLDEKIGLKDATYGCMLRAFSKEQTLDEAIGLYRVILEKRILIKNSAYIAFVNRLLEEDPYAEGYDILMDIVKKGFNPCTSSLSKFISSLCNKRRWREAEELLNVVLERGLLPDSACCCALIRHYCSNRQIDKALELNNKLEKLQGRMDITTYNLLLDCLVKGGRVEDSIRVFDYMKGLELADSSGFGIIIRGLCRAKELRKAMKLHDEMLNMGLKPDKQTYKRLISEFNQ